MRRREFIKAGAAGLLVPPSALADSLFITQADVPVDYVPPGTRIFDGQDYVVTVDDNINTIDAGGTSFGPWGNIKARNAHPEGYPPVPGNSPGWGNGYFYTVDSVPFSSVQIPGVVQARALCVEAWDGTIGVQGDLYMQDGGPTSPQGYIPGDVWFQFWHYAEDDPQWHMLFNVPKMLYPTKSGNWPASGLDALDWMCYIGRNSYGPASSQMTVDNGQKFIVNHDTSAGNLKQYYSITDPNGYYWKPGHVVTDTRVNLNQWQCIRLHCDTTDAAIAAGTHKWEAWIRPYGNPTGWVLVARWEDGEDWAPGAGDGGFWTWAITNAQGEGHRGIKFVDTLSGANAPANSRFYVADYAMAAGVNSGGNGAADLPQYFSY